MRPRFLLLLMALAVMARPSLSAGLEHFSVVTNPPPARTQAESSQASDFSRHVEEVRMACIEHRRLICGKILQVLPDGLVVDSGYTNLMRAPLNKSWLIPGTVVAQRAENLVESSQPDSVCIGQVFLTDYPTSRTAKPKPYDYVVLEAFPMGEFTYTSVGDLRRTVRRFTGKIAIAVKWKLDQEPPPK
jgi:hypothetical protein